MKKYALIFLLQFVVYYGFAQFSVGVTGGLNYSGITYPSSTSGSSYNSSSTSLKPDFNAGIILEDTFGYFSFQPGLLYTTMGSKVQNNLLINSPAHNLYQVETRNTTQLYTGTAKPGV
jgi:hypothetical protein